MRSIVHAQSLPLIMNHIARISQIDVSMSGHAWVAGPVLDLSIVTGCISCEEGWSTIPGMAQLLADASAEDG
jgi:hypothetical protein